MSSLPRVMIGGPIRNREWSVPLWLGGLTGLDYPKHLLTLAALVNDSADQTLDACRWWGDEAGRLGFGDVVIDEANLGTLVDLNQRHLRRDSDCYRPFAIARQRWIDLRTDEEWFLQVDSDIQVPASLLTDLLELAGEHDVKFLAACIVNNHGAPGYASNVMYWSPNLERPLHVERMSPHSRGEGVHPCYLTGAVVLLHRSIFDAGLRYDTPTDFSGGEDEPFCVACAEAGFQPHYAPGVWATHWMTPPVDLGYLRDSQGLLRLSRYYHSRSQHAFLEVPHV